MNRLLATVLAVILSGSAVAAPLDADLRDPEVTFKAYQAAEQASYGEVNAQYRAAIAASPGDVDLGIARCRFIENFEYSEDIDWTDTASEDLDACRAEMSKRWPDAPAARVYQLEYMTGDKARTFADVTWHASAGWPEPLRARIAVRAHDLFKQSDPEKAGRIAVVAAHHGDPGLVAEAIKHLAGVGKRHEAAALAAKSRPATNAWMATERIVALTDMGAAAEARRELDRSVAAGLDVSPSIRVTTYIAAHDLPAANKAGKLLAKQGEEDGAARFELALANGDLPEARALVRLDDGFERWGERYSKVVAKGGLSAFTLPLLPFTLIILLGVMSLALVPGFVLMPVHYRGLARRVRGKTSLPLFEGIGLRHAWIAGAVILIVPLLTTIAMRPDALAPLLNGDHETASGQFSVVAISSLLGLLALLPWLNRKRMFVFHGRGVLTAAGLVVGCWMVIFLLAALSAQMHHAVIGGDSSTLQTRTVQALARNGRSEYGLFATWLLMAVLVPVFEEIIFRGMLLGGLSRHISFGWANVWQGLLFASVHADPPRFLVYLAIGVFAGWLARRYQSLWPAIALHALNNTMAVLVHS